MLQFDTPITVRLQRGEVLAWNGARGMTVEVVSGRIWMTQEHDAQDHFVDAGDAVAVGPAAHAVISAESDVLMRLHARRLRVAPLLRALVRRMRPRDEVREPAYA